MPIPTVVRSTDPGVPILNGLPGSAYNVMKHALDLCGWTLEFDDPENFTCVFRNNPITGSGCYVRVFDNNPDTEWSSRVVSIMLYEDMTDIDTGLGPHLASIDDSWTKKSHTLDATPRDWIVIADDRTAYFYVFNNGSPTPEPSQLTSFGDFNSLVNGINSFQSYSHLGSTSSNYYHVGSQLLNGVSNGIGFSRNFADLSFGNPGGALGGLASKSTNPNNATIGGDEQDTKPDYLNDNQFISPIVTLTSSNIAILGTLRGCLLPTLNMNSSEYGEELIIVTATGAITGMLVSAASSAQTSTSSVTSRRSNCAIIISEDWDNAT